MTIFLLHVKYFIIDVPKDILFIFNLKKSYCACYLLVYFFSLIFILTISSTLDFFLICL